MDDKFKQLESERESRVYQQKMEAMKLVMDEMMNLKNSSEVDKLKQVFDFLGETKTKKDNT